MKISLKKNNYTTFEANDGEEALDMLDKNYINLILVFIGTNFENSNEYEKFIC